MKLFKTNLVATACLLTCTLVFARPTLPPPAYALTSHDTNLRHAVFNRQKTAIWNDYNHLQGTTTAIPTATLNPRKLTITAWIALDTKQPGYRQIAFKANRKSRPQVVDFKFGVYDRILEFGFLDSNETWHGILRAGTELACSNRPSMPLATCPKLPVKTWNFCAATFDEGLITLTMNQKVVATAKTDLTELPLSKAILRLGHGENSEGFPTFHLEGFMADFRIYNQALSQQQLNELFQSQKARVETIPLEWDKFRTPFASQRDPNFKRKLDIVKAYEKNLPKTYLPDTPSQYDIRMLNGMPAMHRNGTPESGMCMMPQCTATNQGVYNSARDFAAANVDYVSEIFWPWIKWGENCCHWWLAPGQYDFKKIEDRLQKIVDANPNVRLLVRWKMNVPTWWLKKHQDQLSVTDTGQKSPQPSFASKLWIDDACTMLHDVTTHLENSRLAKHIAGYLVAGGESSEWYWWGYSQGVVDYSDIAKQGFRQWLKRKYGTDAALQKAWRQPQVTLLSANVPSPRHRKTPEDAPFRDLSKGAADVIDYAHYLSDATTDCLSQAAKTTRQALKTPKLIGSFYGYSMYFAGLKTLNRLGFQNLAKVLKDPNVDFICAPTSYDTRRGGQEGSFIVGYTASLRLHNKLYWDEADMRTHLCTARVTYRTTTPTETTEVNWRTFGNSLTQGTNIWWFLIAGNDSFHDNAIMEDIRKMGTLDKEFVRTPKNSIADVAVLCDENSMHYTTPDHMVRRHTRYALTELPKGGVPYDIYLFDDLEQMPDYKLYVFLNTYFLTAKQREAIQRKLARNKAVAVWLYAPGYLSEGGNSMQNMTGLTGFNFARFTQSKLTDISFANTAAPVRSIREQFNPGFQILNNTPDTTVFATSADGKILSAERTMPWGTSVYLASPITGDFLRHLCRRHGIHVFSENSDIFRANQSFIMIHANTQGLKTITLPKAGKLKDLRTGTVHQANPSISFQMGYGETIILQRL